MTTQNLDEVREQIRLAIEANKIALPRLPEVVSYIDSAIRDNTKSIGDVAKLVSKDAVVSARLMQVANSPLMRGNSKIKTVQAAISRMGLLMTRNLVTCMVLKDQFRSKNKTYRAIIQEAWEDSVEVSAYACAITSSVSKLNPDVAMVIGALHNIGVLPIIDHLIKNNIDMPEEQLRELIHQFQADVGVLVLTKWDFPDTYASTLKDHNNFERSVDDAADIDYTDILVLAKTFSLFERGRITTNLSRLPTFKKVKLDVNQLATMLTNIQTQIDEVMEIIK